MTGSDADPMFSLLSHSCLVHLGVTTHHVGKPCVLVLCVLSSVLYFTAVGLGSCTRFVGDTEALLCWPDMAVCQGDCIAT